MASLGDCQKEKKHGYCVQRLSVILVSFLLVQLLPLRLESVLAINRRERSTLYKMKQDERADGVD